MLAGTRSLRRALGALFLVAYPVVAHVAIAEGIPPLARAAWLCLAAFLFLAVPGVWGAVGALAVTATLLVADAETLLKFPPVIFNLALAVWFGRSLLPGEEPVIGWFARLQRGENLPEELARYTRGLTILWTLFFVAVSALSVALAVFADPAAWSLFANGIDYLLVGALFVGEYVYRRLRYRHYRHASLLHHFRSVFAAGGRMVPRRSARR